MQILLFILEGGGYPDLDNLEIIHTHPPSPMDDIWVV